MVPKAAVLDWSCRTLRLLLERGGFRRFLKPSKPGKKAKEDHLDRFLVLARLSSGSACYPVNLKDGRSAVIREEFGRGCCFLTRLSHTHTHTRMHTHNDKTLTGIPGTPAPPSSPTFVPCVHLVLAA